MARQNLFQGFLSVLAAFVFLISTASAGGLYDMKLVNIDGEVVALDKYDGRVTLIVNVASFCGLTRQNYNELVQLQTMFQQRQFQVLAFPCNQFNTQEPQSNQQIKRFAEGMNANFDLFAKTNVNGPMCQEEGDTSVVCSPASDKCCPTNNALYPFLKHYFPGEIEWNFSKFLVDNEGIPVKRYTPHVNPLAMVNDIEEMLNKGGHLEM